MDNSNIDIAEINRNLQQSYIHYEPNRVDYTISNLELELLEQTGSSIWKDISLATLGLGIPSLVNGCGGYSNLTNNTPITLDIFLNFLSCWYFIRAFNNLLYSLDKKSKKF